MFKKALRSILSQGLINTFFHLPKAILANILYGFPTKKLTVIGVTGTDGKTTTTNMIYQVLKAVGKNVSMVSSINAVIGGKSYDTGFHVTSPDPFMIQRLAKKASESGDEYLVLEVTSHALDQYRFWGIKFEVGVITNITHEHLDYHKTFDNYKNTKLKLTRDVKNAVVNKSIGEIREVGGRIITFGLDKGDFNKKDLRLRLKIPADFNVENALAAMAVAFALNVDRKIAQKTLENFNSLTGRMEEVDNEKAIKIIIDFAHTPNALEQALRTLKDQTKGRLIAVFGAASERDTKKRPMMGEIAAKLADITILTDEDPRYEDRNKIIEEIAVGAYQQGAKDEKNLYKQSDREKAIQLAISLARKGDTVGIFGKGHEKSINYQGKEEPWSDREAIEKVLKDG